MKKQGLARPRERWTQINDYLAPLLRRARSRSRRAMKPRTQPGSPRLRRSTVPFLALIAALAVLTVAIMIIAWPGSQPRPQVRTPPRELGYAPKGWFQRAQKEFR